MFFLEWGWILIELGILMNRLFSFWLLFGRGQGTMEFGFNQEIMKGEGLRVVIALRVIF